MDRKNRECSGRCARRCGSQRGSTAGSSTSSTPSWRRARSRWARTRRCSRRRSRRTRTRCWTRPRAICRPRRARRCWSYLRRSRARSQRSRGCSRARSRPRARRPRRAPRSCRASSWRRRARWPRRSPGSWQSCWRRWMWTRGWCGGSPERDAELVALVNMLADGGGTPPGAVPVATVVLSDQHARRLPRLAAVPTASLRRRVVLLKLLNSHLARALFAVDLSSRASVVAGRRLRDATPPLLRHQVRLPLGDPRLDVVCRGALQRSQRAYGADPPPGAPRRGRRRRRRRSTSAGAFASRLARVDRPKSCLSPPADFGSAREMPADRTLSGRLVLADPPNGALPLRNGRALRGNIALVERGGGAVCARGATRAGGGCRRGGDCRLEGGARCSS